jgi:hypothetical protein
MEKNMTVLTSTINQTITEAKNQGYELIAVMPFTHPADSYMIKCVILNKKGEYVSYIFNRGFQLGHYFDNELDAVRDIALR